MDDMGMSYMRRMTIEWDNGQTAAVWSDESQTDSQMLHDFLCLTDIENYSVSFDSWVLKSAYMKYRMSVEREMADMRREYENFKQRFNSLARDLSGTQQESLNLRQQLAIAQCEILDKEDEVNRLTAQVKDLRDMIPGTSPE